MNETKFVGMWIEMENGDMGQVYWNQPWRTSDFFKRFEWASYSQVLKNRDLKDWECLYE